MTREFTTKSDVVQIVDDATKRFDLLMTGIVVVLFMGFVSVLTAMYTLIQESNNFKATQYQRLSDKLDMINSTTTVNSQVTYTISENVKKREIPPPNYQVLLPYLHR